MDAPDPGALAALNDLSAEDLPEFAPVKRHRDPPRVDDVAAAARDAVAAVPALDDLDEGAEVGITGGSRGIHDMPAVLSAVVDALDARGLEPFVFPAMGSHGGATAEGQVETLESVGITEASVGCEIRASMAVEAVAEDDDGRPVYAAEDAIEADAVLLANRVKLHTDFHGRIESGLAKMAVIGVGKQRGADEAHRAALATGFDEVIPERAALLFEETPIVGGVGVVENAAERAALVEGVPADEILEREPGLLERAEELQPMLPVDDLDLLVLDEIGKNVSGTGMDTNVVGRMLMSGEPEFETPDVTRIYVRGLTEETHGNANGVGLADFAHADVEAGIDRTSTYVNSLTGGQPERGRLPVILPSDEHAFRAAFSTVGVRDPADLRIARIRNTLEPDSLVVSEPVARELEGREGVSVGDLRPLAFEDGALVAPGYGVSGL
ncbi:DUF362 domain-containing protein (plasmid) [Halarchaeum sp. CBA1220]|uniref:DUF362 domain-containing protein n=1 Tax=Halarchaeum sp. CBA1220 TaxID=1853682 RepID=UPI000F3A9E60|nr:DUF362 domain-containing protein [Halarchaeum sp. CBA1220]QLC34745.1 DUF362 domain-containing protein [Halarchaeum sp. CBA1220]